MSRQAPLDHDEPATSACQDAQGGTVPDAPPPAGPAGDDDVAPISLRGRNRACVRTRALAGLTLGVGMTATLTELDTLVSAAGITT